MTDYSGFTPCVGLNLTLDLINYQEAYGNDTFEASFRRLEPEINFGWDILPGKTDEVLILRTNLRWYPFSSFVIEDKKFNFNQLGYNLIQAAFYPSRLSKKRT